MQFVAKTEYKPGTLRAKSSRRNEVFHRLTSPETSQGHYGTEIFTTCVSYACLQNQAWNQVIFFIDNTAN